MEMNAAQRMKQGNRADARFVVTMAMLIVVAHAVAYLTHEYAHSATAWALGYMANPLALDYGSPTPANIVLLTNIGDNVQYDPIMQSGHGLAAAAIALAGACIGNGLLYVLLYAATKHARLHPLARSFTFWLLLMCAGNVWSYVPMRAITTHADIAIAAAGLDVSVLALFPFVLLPSLLLMAHFLARACPLFIRTIAPAGTARTAVMIGMTSTWLFFFYGGVGVFANYGPVSEAFSLVSMLLLAPVATVWLWNRCTDV